MTKQAKEVQQVVSCVQLASGRRPRESPVVKIVKQVSTRRNQGKVFALRALVAKQQVARGGNTLTIVSVERATTGITNVKTQLWQANVQ